MKPSDLRRKHPRFVYKDFRYAIQGRGFSMEFRFLLEPDIEFTSKVVIRGVTAAMLRRIPASALRNFVFHLGLAEIPSYWKCATSPVIEIRAGALDARQIAFWEGLLQEGLGEFFYANGINPAVPGFLRIVSTGTRDFTPFRTKFPGGPLLVPVGGGKDSLLSIELLKRGGRKFRIMILGDVPAARAAARAASPQAPILIERTIDPRLLALNRRGYLNGHTPFSAYLAFLSMLTAALFGCGGVAASQERSADEEAVISRGRKINHQYSKSFAFERKFRAYAARSLSPGLAYFSLLRPLYELQIAERFARFPKYFPVFRSCNVLLKQNAWCGRCAKCFSVYLLLAPFLDETRLRRIFGKNLLAERSLWPYVPALLGLTAARPFDCVGTKQETAAALRLTAERYARGGRPLPLILRKFVEEMHALARRTDPRKTLRAWNSRHFVPAALAALVKKI